MATPEWYARLKRRTAEIIDFENDALERDMVRSQETPSEAQETEEDVARRLHVERERQEEEEIAARLREWNSRNVSKVSRGVYCVLCVLICVTMIALLMYTVTNLPSFGSPDHPINNEVSARYIEKGLQETGAGNIVTGMILDYARSIRWANPRCSLRRRWSCCSCCASTRRARNTASLRARCARRRMRITSTSRATTPSCR